MLSTIEQAEAILANPAHVVHGFDESLVFIEDAMPLSVALATVEAYELMRDEAGAYYAGMHIDATATPGASLLSLDDITELVRDHLEAGGIVRLAPLGSDA